MECHQPTGSFKIRGIGARCREAVDQGATRLVASSGGNAGLAVAYAGRKLNVRVTVAVPETTSEDVRLGIAAEGAEVVVHGAAWDQTHEHALRLAGEPGGVCIHPFDDPIVWRGHATMIAEASRQAPRPDAVVVSVGGGGLFCGVMQGLADVGWEDVPVVAVETAGADSLAQSVSAGRPVTLGRITSIATTLGARRVADRALQLALTRPVTPWVVADARAVAACLRFADDHRVLVEPSCGASLSAVYDAAEPLSAARSVLVIVCGGTGVTIDRLLSWHRRLAT
jgi:L-serine/L-threonine ammonia-lyase